jgi:hypothetical protein
MKRKWRRRRFVIANFRLVAELHRTMLCVSPPRLQAAWHDRLSVAS